jgi:hypothetical protein
MTTPPKQWPDNVEQFRIADLPVGGLDQSMMRLMRKLADQQDWTVEEVMVALVVRCEAERELEEKIIPFPKIKMHTYEVRPCSERRKRMRGGRK